jgi:hypothetical protein
MGGGLELETAAGAAGGAGVTGEAGGEGAAVSWVGAVTVRGEVSRAHAAIAMAATTIVASRRRIPVQSTPGASKGHAARVLHDCRS